MCLLSRFIPEAKSHSTTSSSLWSSLHHQPCSEPHWLHQPVPTIPNWTPWTDLCWHSNPWPKPWLDQAPPASEMGGPSKITWPSCDDRTNMRHLCCLIGWPSG